MVNCELAALSPKLEGSYELVPVHTIDTFIEKGYSLAEAQLAVDAQNDYRFYLDFKDGTITKITTKGRDTLTSEQIEFSQSNNQLSLNENGNISNAIIKRIGRDTLSLEFPRLKEYYEIRRAAIPIWVRSSAAIN